MNRFSRRSFVAGSAKLGLGAAAVGLAGGAADVLAAGAAQAATRREQAIVAHGTGLTSPPPVPPGIWSFVSRPDLTPPGITVAHAPGWAPSALTPRYIFIAPRVSPVGTMPPGSQRGLMILDLNGDMVWFKPLTAAGEDPFNFHVQDYKGKPVLTWFQGTIGPGFATGGECVIMNSAYRQVTTVVTKNYTTDLHEFLLTSEGTALISAYEPTSSLVIGHAQEIDVATGDLILDWPCYPAVAPSESYIGTTGDYFHLNSIDLWPGPSRNLLVSGRDTCAVYLVDRTTKKVIWRLHGRKSNFTTDQNTQFWYQHDARALSDGSGVSLFDDASQVSPEKQSWGKVINLDMTTKTATIRHEFNHTTSTIDTGSQGNFQLLPNGGHFIGWGADPYFSEFAPTGNAVTGPLVLDGRFPTGMESYRAFSSNWTGSPPMSELRIVVLPGSGSGQFVAFVSWNGATNVTSWQVDVGTSPTSLASYAIVPKNGFETSIPITFSGAQSFRVHAYNASGHQIGQSGVVSAS